MRLVGERNEWYTRYMSAINNPDFMSAEEDAVPPAETLLEPDGGIYNQKRVTAIRSRSECRMVLVRPGT